MLEISTSGLMSGDGKRSGAFRAQSPRPSSTLLSDLDEPVAMTRVIDRDRHSDEIGELVAHATERPLDEREAGPRAIDFPSRSVSAVCPASQTILPPWVTIAGEKARDF